MEKLKSKNLKIPDQRDKLEYELKHLKIKLNKLCNQKYKIQLEIEEYQKKIDIVKYKLNTDIPDKLIISKHAIKRFKERIDNLPDKVIKSVLSDKILYNKYLEKGAGIFKLKTHPNILAVVSSYTILTVYSAFDAKMKLKCLEDYMVYWIEQRCQKAIYSDNEDVLIPIITFKNFRKHYYK